MKYRREPANHRARERSSLRNFVAVRDPFPAWYKSLRMSNRSLPAIAEATVSKAPPGPIELRPLAQMEVVKYSNARLKGRFMAVRRADSRPCRGTPCSTGFLNHPLRNAVGI